MSRTLTSPVRNMTEEGTPDCTPDRSAQFIYFRTERAAFSAAIHGARIRSLVPTRRVSGTRPGAHAGRAVTARRKRSRPAAAAAAGGAGHPETSGCGSDVRRVSAEASAATTTGTPGARRRAAGCTLQMCGCRGVTDVSGLARCAAPHTLQMCGCRGVTDVSALAGCAALHTLDMSAAGATSGASVPRRARRRPSPSRRGRPR